MKVLWAFLVVLAVAGLLALRAWLALPTRRPDPRPAAVAPEEQARTIAALAPRRARPVVAVVGDNAGSETTDYLVPFAVLTRSGAADVHALGTGPGPIRMSPALTIEPQATTSDFDARFPEGADYVIVPALERSDSPAVVGWIRSQREKGATVVGICAGAMVLAAAGMLDGRNGTVHWYYVDDLREGHPTMRWV